MDVPLLSAKEMSVSYGPIRAVRGCNFEIRAGETVAIVGTNGAGKSTLMRGLSGVVPIAAGDVRYDGVPVGAVAPHALVRRGLVHVPEGRGVIRHMSVDENLRLAYDMRPPAGKTYGAALRGVFAHFPRLEERLHLSAGNLSGGEQQMLALARALIDLPRLLLVDEPSLGLSPLLTKEVFGVLRRFREAGVTILLVEQNVRAALSLAQRGYVLRMGEIVFSGSSQEMLDHPEIVSQHLGLSH
jgi:branched-chain amino acid transport system ATP-binding protein